LSIRTGYAHARTIKKRKDEIDIIIEWCRQEVKSNWTWQQIHNDISSIKGEYIFYFDSKRDCFSFIIKWC